VPAQNYKFRLDYQGKQFWSVAQTITPDILNSIQINAGGGTFNFTVMKSGTDPLSGARCYVYSEAGSYLNISGTTDSLGQIAFDLAEGRYKIRVDHLGYQFWTDIYTIPDTLSETYTLNHQETSITVEGIYQGTFEPIRNINVYLYSSAGAYQNLFGLTDENGDVFFSIPDAEYKARADYLGKQFWTVPFRQHDTVLEISKGLAKIRVNRSGAGVPGATVYLYSDSGSYLNWFETSDSNGIASFLVPSGLY